MVASGFPPTPEMHPKHELMLRRLIWMQAPKVLVMIVLMVGYLRPVDLSNPERTHDILEFYAGAARLSKLSHAMGGNAAAMDRNYDFVAQESKKKKNNSMDFNTSAGFLLACILILECRFGHFISLMGIACSTWVGISKGSTHRDVALPMGHPHSLAVYRANKAVARTMLLVLMIICAEGVLIIENPGSSLLASHDRFRHVVALLKDKGISLYRQALWMKLYGYACLKRTLLWSTSPMISMMDLGKIQKKKHRSLITTARKYLDKDGRKRYHGTRALKRTELYPVRFNGRILAQGLKLVRTRPEIPEVKPEKSILELLAEMPTGDTDTWNDAELWSVYSYVRASKLLCLPEAFKAVLSSHAC